MSDTPFNPHGEPPVRPPLSGALRMYAEHWRTLVACALVGVLPVAALDAVDYLQSGVDPFRLTPTAGGTESGLSWVVIGVSLALYSLVSAACIRVIAESREGHATDWRSAVSWGAARIGPVLLTSVIVVIGCTLGLIALILPGIWLAVAWCVATPAVVLEGSTPFDAVRRSFGLVRGAWWHTLGVLLLAALIAAAVVIAAAIPVSLAVTVVESKAGRVALSALTETALMSFLLPFGAALLTLLYYDLRDREAKRPSPAQPRDPGERFGGFEPPDAAGPR